MPRAGIVEDVSMLFLKKTIGRLKGGLRRPSVRISEQDQITLKRGARFFVKQYGKTIEMLSKE